jgi:hypothetical protein
MPERLTAALCAVALSCVLAAPAAAKVDTFVPVATVKPTDNDNPEITAVSPDGMRAVATIGNALAFYDLTDPAKAELTDRLSVDENQYLSSVAYTRDGRYALVTSGQDVLVADVRERAFGRSTRSRAIWTRSRSRPTAATRRSPTRTRATRPTTARS